jgi:hypothetical protein
MMLQYDGLGTISEFDEDYKEITDKHTTDVHDVSTGELLCDEWLERDIQESDFRVSYSAEEQLRTCTGFTSISSSTDMTTPSIDAPEDPSGPSEVDGGYDEKLNSLAINLDCM